MKACAPRAPVMSFFRWRLCSASASVFLFRMLFGTGHMLPHGRNQLLDAGTMQPFILPEQHHLSITQWQIAEATTRLQTCLETARQVPLVINLCSNKPSIT